MASLANTFQVQKRVKGEDLDQTETETINLFDKEEK